MNGYLAQSVGARVAGQNRVRYQHLLSQIPAADGQRLWGQSRECHMCTRHKNIFY